MSSTISDRGEERNEPSGIIWLASAPEAAHVTGKYFRNMREVTPSPAARDDAQALRLWAIAETLVAGRHP